MKFWKKPINIALSPNNTWRDNLTAFSELYRPWNWIVKNGQQRQNLEKQISSFLGADARPAFLSGSGREALYMILKAIDCQEGDEIIMQSFTCLVVVNAIVWAGAKPVFVDIDETFNLNAKDLLKKITPKTKAIMVQHTFGIPADLGAISKICAEKRILLIEDCAHALGAEWEGRKVGTIGDFGFYSFGRSKVISCVNGGAAICSNLQYSEKLKAVYEAASENKKLWVFQSLLHPLICSLAKPFYNIGIGKIVMLIAQKLRLINFEVSASEKRGEMINPFPTKLANGLAAIASSQLSHLDKNNSSRLGISQYYYDNLKNIVALKMLNPANVPGAIWLRFPIVSDKAKLIIAQAKKDGIILGDWYNVPVAPADIDQSKSGYEQGSNPECEKICKQIFNLPTYAGLNKNDLRRIVNLVKKYA